MQKTPSSCFTQKEPRTSSIFQVAVLKNDKTYCKIYWKLLEKEFCFSKITKPRIVTFLKYWVNPRCCAVDFAKYIRKVFQKKPPSGFNVVLKCSKFTSGKSGTNFFPNLFLSNFLIIFSGQRLLRRPLNKNLHKRSAMECTFRKHDMEFN